jgi:hypothetical protein
LRAAGASDTGEKTIVFGSVDAAGVLADAVSDELAAGVEDVAVLEDEPQAASSRVVAARAVPDRARAWRRRKVLTDVLLVEVSENRVTLTS